MKKLLLSLFVITLLSGFLRLYRLGELPVGFHIDEASLGYNGYSMLNTGRDEHGNRFPLYVDMFGDNRPSGYHYLTIIPVAVFGLTEFATRLPGALFGTVSALAFFYLVLAVTGDKKVSLLSSVLLAISPWHIVSSRASAESIVSLFFIISGFALVVRSVRKENIRVLVLGFVLLTTSFFFYHTPRVFVPLLVLCVVAGVIKNHASYGPRFKMAGLFCCIALAMFSYWLVFAVSGGTGRFSQVSIFGFPQTKLVMEEQFREDGMFGVAPVIVKAFHNKITNYMLTFISNYSDYFTGKFLFIEGGKPLWYKIPNMGLLYLVELPFIIMGFVYLFTQKRLLLKFPLVWLFAAPIVASITTDDIPNIQRVMVLFPMLELLAAFGILRSITAVTARHGPLAASVVALALAGNGMYFLHQYVVHGSSHFTQYRFNGFKEMVLKVQEQYEDADSIIMTKTSGGIYPHVLFFSRYNPAIYQKEGSPKDPDFGGFGKYIFTPQFCPSIQGDDKLPKSGRIVYVDSGTCEISPLIPQQKIMREDGTVGFIITSNQN